MARLPSIRGGVWDFENLVRSTRNDCEILVTASPGRSLCGDDAIPKIKISIATSHSDLRSKEASGGVDVGKRKEHYILSKQRHTGLALRLMHSTHTRYGSIPPVHFFVVMVVNSVPGVENRRQR